MDAGESQIEATPCHPQILHVGSAVAAVTLVERTIDICMTTGGGMLDPEQNSYRWHSNLFD